MENKIRLVIYIMITVLIFALAGIAILGGCGQNITITKPEASSAITGVFPRDGATNVPITTEVFAVFSNPLIADTINTATFTLASAEGTVEGNVSFYAPSKIATFKPFANLAAGTTYFATIDASVRETSGVTLGSNYTWSFTTASSPQPSSFETFTIDPSGTVAGSHSLVVAKNSKIHISYADSANNSLKYATNQSGSWEITTVDTNLRSGAEIWSSIDVDSNDSPHISYFGKDSRLKYASQAAGQWEITTVDSNSGGAFGTSLEIDKEGKIHISYSDLVSGGHLKYATYPVGGTWSIYTVDSDNNVGNFNSLTVDSNNKVHISYSDATNNTLKYATDKSGTWEITTVDATANVGAYSSIVLDSENFVHISYSDMTNHTLKYATNVGGSWNKFSIATSLTLIKGSSITIDGSNQTHISFYDEGDQKLKYITNAAGSWTTAIIDTMGTYKDEMTALTSIGLDGNRKLHIAYCDIANKTLKYATNAQN